MDKVTIVTVCYNAEKVIRGTIFSVLEQNYPSFEYLIIDGASTDKTVKIINECCRLYPNVECKIISERDDGIYDAMNKGISKATGEWILFMNAGDKFHSRNVISSIFFKEYERETSGIYGDTMRIRDNKQIFVEGKPLEFIKNGFSLPFCHQSIFVRSIYLKELGFDVNYKQAADYKFFCEMYLRNAYFEYVKIIVSDYLMGGISETNTVFHLKEKIQIREELQLQRYSKMQKKYLLMCLAIKQKLKKMLPRMIVDYIVDVRSRR